MKDMEKILLNDTSLDELIKMKIKEEFKSQKRKKVSKKNVITDLKKVPKEHIFTKNSVFKVYNRLNHTETSINGMQADAMIGLQSGIRERILDRTLTAFSTDDAYVQFEKVVISND